LQVLSPGPGLAHCLFRNAAVRDQDLQFLRYLDEWLPYYLARANPGAVAFTRRATVVQPVPSFPAGYLGLKEQAHLVADAFPEVNQTLARADLQRMVERLTEQMDLVEAEVCRVEQQLDGWMQRVDSWMRQADHRMQQAERRLPQTEQTVRELQDWVNRRKRNSVRGLFRRLVSRYQLFLKGRPET
jgi:hypothetical protein